MIIAFFVAFPENVFIICTKCPQFTVQTVPSGFSVWKPGVMKDVPARAMGQHTAIPLPGLLPSSLPAGRVIEFSMCFWRFAEIESFL